MTDIIWRCRCSATCIWSVGIIGICFNSLFRFRRWKDAASWLSIACVWCFLLVKILWFPIGTNELLYWLEEEKIYWPEYFFILILFLTLCYQRQHSRTSQNLTCVCVCYRLRPPAPPPAPAGRSPRRYTRTRPARHRLTHLRTRSWAWEGMFRRPSLTVGPRTITHTHTHTQNGVHHGCLPCGSDFFLICASKVQGGI